MALNAETEKWWWLWTSKLRSDDDSERWNWKAMMTLNAETENATMVVLNVETENATLNVKLKCEEIMRGRYAPL